MDSQKKSFRKGYMEYLLPSLCSGATLAGFSAGIPQRPGLEGNGNVFQERMNLSSTLKIRKSYSERVMTSIKKL